VAAPLWIAENCVEITASIGIAVFPDSAESITDLLKCADLAMYHAKRSGKNAYHMQLQGEAPPRLSTPPPGTADMRGVLGFPSTRSPRAMQK
jgi:hypothetical protein